MATRRICNGHGGEIAEDEFHIVEARRASLAGAGQSVGLATDERVIGDLCNDCWNVLSAFVGDTPDEDAAERIRNEGRLLSAV